MHQGAGNDRGAHVVLSIFKEEKVNIWDWLWFWRRPPMQEVIVSYGIGNLQLYRVNADGSNRRRITNDVTHSYLMPAWSPDGTKIVYLREEATGYSVWISDPLGNNSKMVVPNGINLLPSWAPDSIHIAWFVLLPNQPVEASKLYLMDTVNMQSRLLFTDPEQSKWGNLMPSISPDATKVAFVSNRSGLQRIWVSNLDGSNGQRISPGSTVDSQTGLPIEQKVPCWSPDGKWIAHWEGIEENYLSGMTGISNPQRDALISASWKVCVVDRNGQNKRTVGHGDNPNWSPDGFVTRAFPDAGGVRIMIETPGGGSNTLPIVPPGVPQYARFTWRPTP